MPHLILSDIHANMEALEAVLADARGQYDRIYCLGDLVGYGADPNAAVAWVRTSVAAVIRGNHDKVCTGTDSLDGYNPAAQASTVWTRRALTRESRDYLDRLPRGPLRQQTGRHSFDLVHGSPEDEDEYLIAGEDVRRAIPFMDAPLYFFGHTHVQGGFLIARNNVRGIHTGKPLRIEDGYSYLVNPGSVGQPRDGDPRAAYVLYSPGDRTVEYRRVGYDIDSAARKIGAAGLPASLALRLFEGM